MKMFISKLHYKKELTKYENTVFSVLKFFGIFYTAVSDLRNILYDKKILKSYGSKAFVVSVGNLTTGGVGKTPFVLEAAKYFLSLNKKVAIISRGYGGKLSNKKPNLISDGSGSLFKASVAGDEPVWLSNNAKGAYVVTCSSRIRAEKFLEEKYCPDVIILDDAFQHRKMKRDMDIVLIDAKKKFGNKQLLPAGPLREKITSLNRAEKIVVVNKGFETEAALKLCDKIKKKYDKATYLCKLVPEEITNIITGAELPKNSRIMAFSAIGQPESFYELLKKNYKLVAVLEFDDHHCYDKSDISKIIEYAQEENVEYIVTTEKDSIKLIDIITDIEMPVKFFELKLKSYVDIKEILGD